MARSNATTFLIGVPNIGVGLLWAMNMNLVPLLVAQFTSEKQMIGLLTSMGAVTGIFVQYLAGLISDRSHFSMGRRKPFILGGSLAATVFLCLMPFCGSYWALFACAFLFYFSLNFYQGPYYSMIPEVIEFSQLGAANGFSKIISVLGAGAIFFLGPRLWESSHSFPFFLAAAMALSSVLFALFFIKEDTKKVHIPQRLAFDFYRFPAVMQLFAAVFFVYLAVGTITPFFVMYCSEQLNLSATVASQGLLALTLAGAALAYPIGMMADKTGHRRIFLLGALTFTIGLFMAVFLPPSPNPIWLYACMSVVGIGFIALQITSFALLASIVPRARLGEFIGLMNLFISLPQFIGNIAMGPIIDHFGYRFFFPTAAVLMLVAAFLAAIFKFKNDNLDAEASL